jgi:Secretion system C-terminal sorting domain
MKITTTNVLGWILVLGLGFQGSVKACNLSYIQSLTISKSPLLTSNPPITDNDSVITVRFCIGFGVTFFDGAPYYGAGGPTRDYSFAWYTHRSGFLIRSFTPATVTSGRSMFPCTVTGSSSGPAGPPYNSQAMVYYTEPGGGCDTAFACVSTPAGCDTINEWCVEYSFQVNMTPDSVRVWGIEGNGNPTDVKGCYYDTDLVASFTLLSLNWGTVEAYATGNSVQVKWTTLSEKNTDLFIVQRAQYGHYADIGSVAASGQSSSMLRYEFTDLAPMPGVNRYRIKQVDRIGGTMLSPLAKAIFTAPKGLAWGALGPNPAPGCADLTFYDERDGDLTLTIQDNQGQTVMQKNIQYTKGSNAIRLDISSLDAGIYFVRLRGASGNLSKKLVKL